MKVFMLLLLLHTSAINPFTVFQITDVKTVETALVQLNKAFPDWKANYKENEFDCSEMSALVFQYLKACGLNPELKTGYNFREGYGHAWVVCQSKIIESTWLAINPNKAFYDEKVFTPAVINESIAKTEYDWWNSPYILGKANDTSIAQLSQLPKTK